MNAELDAMPFVVDSLGQRQKHNRLTGQLEQLLAAEKSFSRRKVIVADDAPPILPL